MTTRFIFYGGARHAGKTRATLRDLAARAREAHAAGKIKECHKLCREHDRFYLNAYGEAEA